MADYEILPSTLNLKFVRGDEFGMLLDFSIDLTGYTFVADIYEVSAVQNGVPISGGVFLPFTQTLVDLSTGQINLSLQETQTQSFNLGKSYRWYLRWVSPGLVTRTVLSGAISIGDP